jgi:hypothetical protein
MNQPRLLSGEQIRELIREVAEELDPKGTQTAVVLVGGSLLAWHGLRFATEDVDSSLLLDEELRSAVQRVAKRHQLTIDWLNDHSAPWHPQTLLREDCDVLLNHPRLLVLGAPFDAIFLMKLNRSEPQDVLDMIMIWPLVAAAWPTAQDVTNAFYAAYPLEEHDSYLGDQVIDIAQRAGLTLPLE